LITALRKEITLQHEQNYLESATIETIYFGGGTPSILSVSAIELLLSVIYQHWTVHPDAEITLEANPDDLNENALRQWKSAGINRLSIGIQSLFEDELKWMNRAHSAAEALSALDKAMEAGFEKLSADFIYGSPLLTDERWAFTLNWLTEKKIPHVSCYALTIEPKTPFGKKPRTMAMIDAEQERQHHQFLMLIEAMEKAGYEEYEISNFSLPGKRSRHNTAYWDGKPYLGIGPSAHSYNGDSRQWNVSNNHTYMKAIAENRIPAEKEILTPLQQLNEYLMTSLRRSCGCNLNEIAEHWGENYATNIKETLPDYVKKGMMHISGSCFTLTRHGKLFADKIASDLFFT
jgi:oxygen-independent coproporphyrinogen-3 oxidase